MHLTELHEVLLELLRCQLEIEAANKDLALWVGELYCVFGVIAPADTVLLNYLYVRIWLLNVLSIVRHHELVVRVVAAALVTPMVMAAAHVSAIVAALVVIRRLDINALLKDPVAFRLVLIDDISFYLLGLLFVFKAEQDKAEAATALCDLLSHDNRVLDLAKLLEVLLQVRLRGREG